MNIRKLFEEIQSRDSFSMFWRYPAEKNLSILSERLSYIKSAKELKSAIAQICAAVFEENEEGSFLYTEAQNLLQFAETLIDKALATASVTGVYIDPCMGREDQQRDTNKVAVWEEAVTEKLCEKYKKTLVSFTEDLPVKEIQEHVNIILSGDMHQ